MNLDIPNSNVCVGKKIIKVIKTVLAQKFKRDATYNGDISFSEDKEASRTSADSSAREETSTCTASEKEKRRDHKPKIKLGIIEY